MSIARAGKNPTARIEFYVILAVTFVAGLVAIYHNAFELMAVYVEQHDSWELDEFIVAYMAASMGCFVLLFRRARQLRHEIVRREASEESALKLARHDPLTGLANRRVLEDDLKTALSRVHSTKYECAVFLIDLDRFKPINDTHGHVVGDAVLVEMAARLTDIVHGSGLAARMGGDEFACIIPYPAGQDVPARLAATMARRLSEPVRIGELRLETGASIGIARGPRDGGTASELLHGADLALYEAKREKRGSYRFFDAEMDSSLRERTSLEADLRAAVANGKIVPHFQPVMDLSVNEIIGFEALARWPHATRGMVPPDTFIPLAEDLGIIDQISYAMLHSACSAAREWPDSIWLAVNISPLQLRDPWLAARLLAILAEVGFPGGRLVVEVTENAAIDDIMKAEDIFTSLQNAGVRIALDDFGKGYSSLFHLRELKFDHLKIDRSFIHSMKCPESAKIVSAVTGLGRSMGMPVTAEGVETLDEADALRELGCEHAQGYLFGKALNAEDTLALLRSHNGADSLARCA